MTNLADLPPLPVDLDAPAKRRDDDGEFVDREVVAQLVLRALGPDVAEMPMRQLPAASPDDYAAVGGVTGGRWAAAPVRMPALVVRDEEFGELEWADDDELLDAEGRQTGIVRLEPQGGRKPMPARTLGAPATSRRVPVAAGRIPKPRRAVPPRPARRAGDPEEHFGTSRRPAYGGLWVMFSSAVASVVLFLLGAILLNRPAPGPTGAGDAPATVRRAGMARPPAPPAKPATDEPAPPAAPLAASKVGDP